MKTLLEDYKRKLASAEQLVKDVKKLVESSNDLAYTPVTLKTLTRLRTKASTYRATIVDIERAIERTGEVIQGRIDDLSGGDEMKSMNESFKDDCIVEELKKLKSTIVDEETT